MRTGPLRGSPPPQTSFMVSSSMLGKLVQVHKKAGEFKVKLKLCSIDPEIRQVFKITKLDKLFEIETDEASARAAFMKRGWFG